MSGSLITMYYNLPVVTPQEIKINSGKIYGVEKLISQQGENQATVFIKEGSSRIYKLGVSIM